MLSGLFGFRTYGVSFSILPLDKKFELLPLVMDSRMESVPPVVMSRKPSPLISRTSPRTFALGFIVDPGRDLIELPVGLLVGVEDGLSTLALRDPDRGVMFELSKPFTGVPISSRSVAFGVRTTPRWPSFVRSGDEFGSGIPESRGPPLKPLLARAAIDGLPVAPPSAAFFLLSKVMSRVAKVAVMVDECCGVRIVASLSARMKTVCAHPRWAATPAGSYRSQC